jgi:hypothetical protein
LGWDTDATGRIYSSEYTSESAAKKRKYYTRATGQYYSGTKEYSKSGSVSGTIEATVTST